MKEQDIIVSIKIVILLLDKYIQHYNVYTSVYKLFLYILYLKIG